MNERGMRKKKTKKNQISQCRQQNNPRSYFPCNCETNNKYTKHSHCICRNADLQLLAHVLPVEHATCIPLVFGPLITEHNNWFFWHFLWFFPQANTLLEWHILPCISLTCSVSSVIFVLRKWQHGKSLPPPPPSLCLSVCLSVFNNLSAPSFSFYTHTHTHTLTLFVLLFLLLL